MVSSSPDQIQVQIAAYLFGEPWVFVPVEREIKEKNIKIERMD